MLSTIVSMAPILKVNELLRAADGKSCGTRSRNGRTSDPKGSMLYIRANLARTVLSRRSGSPLTGTASFCIVCYVHKLIGICSRLLRLLPLRVHLTSDLQARAEICHPECCQFFRDEREFTSLYTEALTADSLRSKFWNMRATFVAHAKARLRPCRYQ